MHLGARLQAATEVLSEIDAHHRPTADALRDWGRTHRFAGSGDRAVIGNLVFDALRNRRSLAARLGSDAPKLIILGVAVHLWELSVDQVAEACIRQHGPGELSDDERAALSKGTAEHAAPSVQGDFPDWLEPSFARAFGDAAVPQAEALAERAPVDLRVNTLKANRDKVEKALARFSAAPTALSPVGLRIEPPRADKRYPHVESETAHGRGWFEVQDQGSQIAALMTGAKPGMQVIDLCAGAGGKTLALAAAMNNKGQIYAYDADRTRLRKSFDRFKRAGARNIQVLDAGDQSKLADLEARADVVLIDAPCTGSGTWRRRPDAKWRLSEQALARRLEEQRSVLALAAPLVKPGGRLVYVTCSVLAEENGDQVEAFLSQHPTYRPVPYRDVWDDGVGGEPPASADGSDTTLLLTPRDHGTDGFFIAVLEHVHGSQ